MKLFSLKLINPNISCVHCRPQIWASVGSGLLQILTEHLNVLTVQSYKVGTIRLIFWLQKTKDQGGQVTCPTTHR